MSGVGTTRNLIRRFGRSQRNQRGTGNPADLEFIWLTHVENQMSSRRSIRVFSSLRRLELGREAGGRSAAAGAMPQNCS